MKVKLPQLLIYSVLFLNFLIAATANPDTEEIKVITVETHKSPSHSGETPDEVLPSSQVVDKKAVTANPETKDDNAIKEKKPEHHHSNHHDKRDDPEGSGKSGKVPSSSEVEDKKDGNVSGKQQKKHKHHHSHHHKKGDGSDGSGSSSAVDNKKGKHSLWNKLVTPVFHFIKSILLLPVRAVKYIFHLLMAIPRFIKRTLFGPPKRKHRPHHHHNSHHHKED